MNRPALPLYVPDDLTAEKNEKYLKIIYCVFNIDFSF